MLWLNLKPRQRFEQVGKTLSVQGQIQLKTDQIINTRNKLQISLEDYHHCGI
jgi:hypothetical protein